MLNNPNYKGIMINKIGKCLSDIQVAEFVDGCLSDNSSIIKHLNTCADCFEQVTDVMNFIEEYADECTELNDSYNNMITEDSDRPQMKGIN